MSKNKKFIYNWGLQELVNYLMVSKSWVYKQTYRDLIPHKKIAGRLRFSRSEINQWVRENKGQNQ